MKLPRAKVRLAVAGLLLVLLVTLIGRSLWAGGLERRLKRYRVAGQPVTLTELQAWYAPVPATENAATPFLEASYDLQFGGASGLSIQYGGLNPGLGEAWPATMLAAAQTGLAANAKRLAQMHAALERPRSRYPINLALGYGTILDHLRWVPRAGEYLAFEARYAAEVGDPERAAEALLASLKVARTLEEEPLLPSYSARLGMNRVTVAATEAVLSRTPLTDGQLRRLQAAFVAAEATNHLGRAVVGERCRILGGPGQPGLQADDGFADMPDGVPPFLERWLLRLYDRPSVRARDLEFVLDRLDDLFVAGTRPRSEMPARRRQMEEDYRSLLTWRGRLRLLGRQTMLEHSSVLLGELDAVAALRCAQTATAVERWRLVHGGAVPGSLTELVPQYLAAVPEDPWDAQPLKYRIRPPVYVIYSVGEDEVDDGGKVAYRPGIHQNRGEDITFTVTR